MVYTTYKVEARMELAPQVEGRCTPIETPNWSRMAKI